jgi:hypothetical protein
MITAYPSQWPTGWPRTERRQWSNFKVRAIDLTIAALRRLDRWGTKELVNAAFSGFKALPPGGDAAFVSGQPTWHSKEDWWEVLGVSENAPKEVSAVLTER